ncbi:DUF2459 domain-containing protein [Altererythrobacter palmitatis]|uniref:DUF2459 domain-containing protein n=1 Tax=Alteraurantiacibacter palmitatis TaxID=2054628 RepID=UPI0030199515
MLAGAVLVFLLSAWIGSSLPREVSQSSAGEGITIMVETNGVHTGIIMPIVSPEMDWRAVFPSAGWPVNGRVPTHIAVGWGEREVFLSTPTWADLKASTALRIALAGGEPVMRVSHYVRPATGENFRPLTLSRADYARMAEAIAASLAPADGPHAPLRGVDPHDAYYPARGTYTLAQTCNSWVGDMLAHGGVKMGRWTPFAGGVMKWIDPPSAS